MNYQNLVRQVLQMIDERYNETKTNIISFNFRKDPIRAYRKLYQVIEVLKQLEDKGFIEIIYTPESIEGDFRIYLKAKIHEYFNREKNIDAILNKDEMQSTEVSIKKTGNKTKNSLHVAEIEFTKSREIILHLDKSSYVISKPNSFLENESVMTFLYENPDELFTKERIEKTRGEDGLKKTLPKIVEKLGFKGKLKNTFFEVSNTKIKFTKRVELTEGEYKSLLKEISSKRKLD